MAQCPNCQAEVAAGFKFCKQCGAGLEAPRPTEAPRQPLSVPSSPPPPRPDPPAYRHMPTARRRGRVIPLVIVIIVLGFGAAGFYVGADTLRAYLPFGGGSKPLLKADQHLNQGLTFASSKDYNNAIIEFTKAIEVDPKYAPAYVNRGVAYMQQKKFNKALDDLKQAEGLNPKDKMVYYNLSAFYSIQNQRDRALDALDKTLELGFTDYDALRGDPDLTNLRRDPEFRKVLEKHKVFLQ